MRVNELEFPQPDTINWHPPEVIVRTINDEPVVGATWKCSLGYEKTTPNVYSAWAALLGQRVEFLSPTPFSRCEELVAGFVESVEPRFSFDGQVVTGYDVTISGIFLRRRYAGGEE